MISTCELHPKTVVVYEGHLCPLCCALEEIITWEKQEDGYREIIEELEGEITQSEKRCAACLAAEKEVGR